MAILRSRFSHSMVTPLLSFALISFALTVPSSADDLKSLLDQAASDARTSRNAVGLTVAVQLGEELVLSKGYGMADLEHSVPATADTVYHIASVTKELTAAAILKLVEEGRMKLEDTARRHIPIFDEGPEGITIHHLLNHTSGLHNFTRSIGDRNRLPLEPDEVLVFFEKEKPDFAPGKGWRYSNSGYFLLGLAIEKAAGTSYGNYIEEHLLAPHGLKKIVYCDKSRLIEHRAQGYVRRDGVLQNSKQFEMNAPFAAGALCSTASDLTKWAHALFQGEVISAEMVEKMTTPVKVKRKTRDYGYGVVIDDIDGRKRFQHAGSIAGFTAFLAYFPDMELGVAVLVNTGRVDAMAIGDELSRVVFANR